VFSHGPVYPREHSSKYGAKRNLNGFDLCPSQAEPMKETRHGWVSEQGRHHKHAGGPANR